MMNFESKLKHESKTHPGVAFVLKNPKASRRGKLRLLLADKSYEIASALRELRSIRELAKAGGEVDLRRAAELDLEFEQLNDNHIKPAKVRWLLKSITGLLIDGQLATVESLIEDGPEDLYDEIFEAIEAASGLSEQEAGESAPASTSGGPVAGEIRSTTAESVENQVPSKPETATE